METSHGVLQRESSEEPVFTSFIPPCAGRVKGRHHNDRPISGRFSRVPTVTSPSICRMQLRKSRENKLKFNQVLEILAATAVLTRSSREVLHHNELGCWIGLRYGNNCQPVEIRLEKCATRYSKCPKFRALKQPAAPGSDYIQAAARWSRETVKNQRANLLHKIPAVAHSVAHFPAKPAQNTPKRCSTV